MPRISLELSDTDIKIKLDQLIGERITRLTDSYIQEHISRIIDKKIERLDMDEICKEAIRNIIIKDLEIGEPGRYNGQWNSIIRNVATNLIEEQFKLKGLFSG